MTKNSPLTASEESGGRRHDAGPSGFRLPGETRLGPVVLQVADLSRSLRYYQEIMGFRRVEHTGSRAVLAARGDDTPVVELRERPDAGAAPRRGRLGLYHVAFLLPDRQALGRFAAHLAELGIRPGAADHLVSEAFYLQDPDGLGIEVYADRPRNRWQYRGEELVMDTKPLDTERLMRRAEGRSWEGMPPGTTVGHVHLHVGDLEKAASFYHERLGLDVTTRSFPGALFLASGGYHHHLGLNTWAGPGAVPPQPGDAQLLEWTLVVPDENAAEGAARSIEEGGYEIERADDSWLALDPWRTQLRIVSAAADS